ncbi:MAG: hypothetical protein K8I02_12595, partial [Candidatus Methylomirabilis sp.]|nr:hypothetical protein [Deltaproteobacteria bacterium]
MASGGAPRVLFINPLMWVRWGVHSHVLRDWLSGEAPTSVVYPPLELAYAAALARSLGCKTGLIEAGALHLRHPETVRRAARFRPDLV